MTAPISTRSDASTGDLVTEVLQPLVDVLILAGFSRTYVLDRVSEVFDRVDSDPNALVAVHLGNLQRGCMEVMCLWRRDSEFLGPNGLPRNLPIVGNEGSFESLCRRAGVQGDPHQLLETLVAFGAVSRCGDDTLKAETPTFLLSVSKDASRVAFDGVLKQLVGFVRVVHFNVTRALNGGRRRFERTCTVVVAEELVPVFERMVRERAQVLIDVLDEWLERHKSKESPAGRYVEVGAGAYFVDLGNNKRE